MDAMHQHHPCDTAVQSPLIKQSGNIHVYRQVRKGLRDKK
ncbi:hypothetical protein UUU_00730 [Klebsiella pneumoniae subsp. pneumoniae DSM 30104 = JCM 1662 = NBRC 14940]|nr:hypothetical protein UUU_00730 [Klebsiella pneumoniae subsp. pneumoniae DSM 30104 = JCM 1662 = NBRC 14940]